MVRLNDRPRAGQAPPPFTGVDLERAITAHLKYSLGKPLAAASRRDIFTSLARTARDLSMDVMLETEHRYAEADLKSVAYLSMEFLVGRSLGNNLINLGIHDLCRDVLERMGYDLEEVREEEIDPGLGNGGLGRLAACFLDSMATLGIPGYGYGINYEFGLFKQSFEDGHQVEQPDSWLAFGNPWELERPDQVARVPLRGHVAHAAEGSLDYRPVWHEGQELLGLPFDMPVVGYRGQTVNRLRLYAARASDEFDMRIFNQGDYIRAVQQKVLSENVSKVLYPNDSSRAGQELRLTQEYFLVACALHDIIGRYKTRHATMDALPEKVAIQLNDTHPALAVAELMRLLLDQERIPWERAWPLTVRTLSFTNHTLMPEALERWPAALLGLLLPRHLQIIEEINRRFLCHAGSVITDDSAALGRLAIVTEEHGEPAVRMANLAIVGSHAVNGVAELHSRLLVETTARDFHRLWPERFSNKTNGITPRRWLLKANPALAAAISERIGDRWITDLDALRDLAPHATEQRFQEQFLQVKEANKRRLARLIQAQSGVTVDPASLFDVHAKRLHEYKRQLLNALHIVHLYLELLENPNTEMPPRAFIFAAKAAPGYQMAKLIIKCINSIAAVVNADPRVCDRLRVVFLPDYRVSLAEKIIPAADLSEQISTAGKEASGTGNMKFALNGALIIGTLDGANIEIQQEVGAENLYIFGLTVEEIARRRAEGHNPWDAFYADGRIRRVVQALESELFCPGQPGLFQPLVDALLWQGDEYFVLADLAAYIETQARAGSDYQNRPDWARRAILNVAGMGKFSSDRTIREYARDIWDVTPAAHHLV